MRKASQREQFCSPFLREPAQTGVPKGVAFRGVRKDLLGEGKNTEKPLSHLARWKHRWILHSSRRLLRAPRHAHRGPRGRLASPHPLVFNPPMGGPAVTDAFPAPVPTESPRALPDGSQQAGELGPAQHLPLARLPTGDTELESKGTTTTRAFYHLPAWERRPHPPTRHCPAAQTRGSES